MTLTELTQEVYTLTNRPDLVNETLTAVRSATLKMHQSDYYFKDLAESGVQFSTLEYLQQIEYRTLFPLYRALKYIRKTDSQGYDQGAFFDIIPPENVVDDYNLNRTNVCYVAGAVIQLRSSIQFQYILLGRYENPNITASGYNSWIALDHPYAIVYEAAATVFKMVGDTDQFAAFNALAAQQMAELRMSNIQVQGY
jgi:hypothetical protein